MAIETVSRVLGKFQEQGVIEVHRRILKIISKEILIKCMHGSHDSNIGAVNNINVRCALSSRLDAMSIRYIAVTLIILPMTGCQSISKLHVVGVQ